MKVKSLVKASAMQFAILVSVIVALLLSSFLLLVYTHTMYSVQSDQVLNNIKASNAGVQYLCEENNLFLDSLSMEFHEVPVTLQRKYWGGFEMIRSKGGSGSGSFEKAALLGSQFGKEAPAIYLENNQLPLVLVSQTRIEGNTFTPEDNIKPGSIAGHYFSGEKLIYGRRYRSNENLPVLNPQWKEYVRNILKVFPDQEVTYIEQKTSSHTFFTETQVIYEVGKIQISETIKGNIILKSESEIEITSFSRLDQVLIIAPKVVFRKGFKGNVHVISEEVVVEENVKIVYPSSIVVLEKENPENNPPRVFQPKLSIGKNSLFQGNLIYLNSSEEGTSRNDLLIEENAMVEGSIYSEGYTEIKGKISGSVYTRYFVANQNGSLYINHIYNGNISTSEVKENMAGILLEGQSKSIASWLY